VKVTPRDGKPFRRSGYTLSLFRREPSGAWVLARDANLMTGE
jgi:ketosteroid isomerase-like protein